VKQEGGAAVFYKKKGEGGKSPHSKGEIKDLLPQREEPAPGEGEGRGSSSESRVRFSQGEARAYRGERKRLLVN